MKSRTSIAVSWVALAAAVLSWLCVGYFAWTISADEVRRTEAIQTAQQTALRHDVAVRLHALVQDTAGDRARLDALLATDVVSAVELIEGAGKAAGISAQLGNAAPESAPTVPNLSVDAVGFVVAGEGTFAELMHALQLFETLSLPSSIRRFDLEHLPDAGATWTMNTSVSLLTSSTLSP